MYDTVETQLYCNE